jgi:hypothetical protein
MLRTATFLLMPYFLFVVSKWNFLSNKFLGFFSF